MNYSSINIQGNILGSEILEKIRTEDIRYQSAKDFGFDPQTSIRDEITLAWSLAVSHWNAFKQKKEKLSPNDSGTTETRNHWMKPLLAILGYDLSTATAEKINGKTYAISFRATNIDNFPIHIVGINQSLDARAESGGPRLSPHALVQEYLNNQEHMYALVSNGKFLRLLRDATRLSRLSYIEFNLEQMMEESLYAEFALLFRVLHSSRMPQKMDSGAESILEFYHQEALASGSRIRERLSEAVEQSIKELANGFLKQAANETLRTAIAQEQVSAKDYYLYNLRIIYRILFLMVIEERKLIYPSERDEKLEQHRLIYYSYYSVQRLTKLVEKSVYVDPRKTDLWQSLATGFALFESSRYGKQLGIAPLGSGLFAPEALGVLTEQVLDNDSILRVLRHLVTFENENGQRVRVNYADLDVEEFGSVYEGLLEYEPQFVELTVQPVFIFKKGNERSKSGSHYTPEELVKPLIQHSLDYLIQDKLKEKNAEAALLSLKVCDVACGSGHILLSAARRIGYELAKQRSNGDEPSPLVLRKAIRDVINHCIYGVDKNPLAVELCKVAMWLEAHNPGEPLNFLDHHIKCGDAIVGLAHREELEKGIADEAFKPLPSDDKQIASSFLKRNKQERKQKEQGTFAFEASVHAEVEAVIEKYNLFKNLPERTPEEVADKEKQYRNYEQDYHRIRLRQLADAQVAQFFVPKTDANKPVLITDNEYRNFLRQVNKHIGVIQSNKLVKAEHISREKRFFHWFLEFPEVFNDGGFDCVLGNPPFLGGQKLSGTFGNEFLEYIKHQFTPIGAVDLVTYFFRRIFALTKQSGFQSLISTNTIAQGKSREDGLDIICSQGGSINHAIRSMRWPGQAAVEVSLVTIYKGSWSRDVFLDSKKVNRITPYLDDSGVIGNPFPLKANAGKSFQGSIVLGKGFVLSPQEAEALIKKDPRNKDVLFPYLNGDDLNNDPEQKPSRWVINFFDWPEEKARAYTDCFEIVERLVKPERQRWKVDSEGKEILGTYALRKPLPQKWWIYGEKRPALYNTISQLDQVMVIAQVSKTLAFTFVPKNQVISMMCIAFAFDDYFMFGLLQNNIHQSWVQKYASALKSDTRYTPSDVFETFPFPFEINNLQRERITEVSKIYYCFRKALMQKLQLGLTKIYNQFHNRDLTIIVQEYEDIEDKIFTKEYGKNSLWLKKHLQNIRSISFNQTVKFLEEFRNLQTQLDLAILEAYGWTDVQLRHGFYELENFSDGDRIRFTIHPEARKELIKRLLKLNHQLYHIDKTRLEHQSIKAGGRTKDNSSLKLF